MPRQPIHQLTPLLVNRIAAGEVIERPASVVKELVENALDAGAKSIRVEVEDGGRELIRIIDDGGGIPPEELPLAFASHATSKLLSDEDLFNIRTMGFRGEALASIGAVSQARLLSRTPEIPLAHEIFDRGGTLSPVQAAAGNTGTIVEIRNLFFNTPARRKFLKGAATELGHISETLLALALPNPQVAFSLLHNNRVVLELPVEPAADRLLAAWPEEFRPHRLDLDAHDAEIHLTGLIGLPELARPTGKYQFFYLNNRPIRDRQIQHALREAYRGLTEPGRQPAAVLMLQMPTQDVDVNVHPTKSEVRFRDGNRIHGLVHSAIREKLLGSNLAPRAVPRGDSPDEPPRQSMREALADFFRRPPGETGSAAPPSLAAEAASPRQIPTPAGSTIPTAASSETAGLSLQRQAWSAPSQPTPSTTGPIHASTIPNTPPVPHAAPVPAIQLHNSYLVAQSDEGMIIIDQHALHERIIYEELLARLNRGPLESQRMLIPATLPATGRQLELLDQIQPLLLRLGIEAVPFGPQTVAVQAFPSFLERLDPSEFIADLLDRGEQEMHDLHQEELLHEILDMMACKAAVKAGDPLSAAEIESLLQHRGAVERSSNCPHGRPTTLRLSLHDLEKQFKRTGF